ncbi:uncharacterized protein [Asterias amurensis]|uniref:uncharacterized protein n=1 Tax=Asterias amurensis TaxID=7602 RepID=UPI003AB324ED
MKSFIVMVLFVSLAWKATVQQGYSSSSSSSSDTGIRYPSSSLANPARTVPSIISRKNLNVFEVSNVTFRCLIPNYGDIGNVYWFQGSTRIADCRQGSVPEASGEVKRISVSVPGSIGLCDLKIYQVTPMDTSQYFCGFSKFEDDAREEEISGSGQSFSRYDNDDDEDGLAFLTVLSATLSPPICEVLPFGDLNVGDNVSLTCKPPENSQLSLLAWYVNKTDTSLAPQKITKGSSFVVSRVLSVQDNLESFTCIAAGVRRGQNAYKNRPSCSITPLSVIFTVGLVPHTGSVSDRAEALFHCVTRSLYPVKRYHWHILRGNKIQYVSSTCGGSCRYKLSDGGKILAIPEVHMEEDDGLQVKCSAVNTHNEEESSHWGLLTIDRPDGSSESSSQDGQTSHSHAGANVAGVFAGLAFVIMVVVLACYIHKKRLVHNCLTRRASRSGPDASQAGNRAGQHGGCKESTDMVYEIPKEQQDTYEVPKECQVYQGGERTDADKCTTYDIPKPARSVDNVNANTSF